MVGGATHEHVQSLVLPGSGWLLQWRSDGFWREVDSAQHRAEVGGSHLPAEDDWVRWSGTFHQQAKGGGWDGRPTWWLIYGELPEHATPSVVLADGQRPSVVLLVGKVWACEWFSQPQPATLHMGGEQFAFAFAEPRYRRFLA
jgi:hypothetical protein